MGMVASSLRPNGYYFVSIGMYVFTNDEWNCVWVRKEGSVREVASTVSYSLIPFQSALHLLNVPRVRLIGLLES